MPGPDLVRVGSSAWPSATSARSGSSPRGCARARPTPPARAGRRDAAPAASPAARRPGRRSASPPSGTGPRRRSAVGRSIHSSSRRGNSTLSIPSSRARSRAISSIASAPSLEISDPPGMISSAARNPVSPGPGGQLEHPLAGLQRERARSSSSRPASRMSRTRVGPSPPPGRRLPPSARASPPLLVGSSLRYRSCTTAPPAVV